MKFVCVNCSRVKGRKIMYETDKFIEKIATMHRKIKIAGKRKKVQGKAFKRKVAIGTCPHCGNKTWKFMKS